MKNANNTKKWDRIKLNVSESSIIREMKHKSISRDTDAS